MSQILGSAVRVVEVPDQFPKRSGGQEIEKSVLRVGGAGERPETRLKTEVTAKAKRRQFTAEYKLRIVQEADAATDRGAIGAMLRREGLYWSTFCEWRNQRQRGELKGLTPRKRGRKAAPINPLQAELDQVKREKRVLEKKLARVHVMLDIQKKASEMLGIPLRTLELDEND